MRNMLACRVFTITPCSINPHYSRGMGEMTDLDGWPAVPLRLIELYGPRFRQNAVTTCAEEVRFVLGYTDAIVLNKSG